MDQEEILQYMTQTFSGIEVQRPTDGPGIGDTFIFYDPQHNLDPQRRMPFATIVTKDYGDFDNRSQLHRPSVFRLNIGVRRGTFRALFDAASAPERSAYDYAVLDRLLPHPVYASQSWVCVLNPSNDTFETIKPLLADAYTKVASRHARHDAETT